MTTLIAYMSRSGGGIRTLYLGADSLGTHIGNPSISNNFIKKVYASETTAEIFALSGNDVDAGQYFLRRVLDGISVDRFKHPIGSVARAMEITDHPAAKLVHLKAGLDIVYAVRDGAGKEASFAIFRFLSPRNAGDKWSVDSIPECNFPKGDSVLIRSFGADRHAYEKRLSTLVVGNEGRTAKQYFWALCDLIDGIPKKELLTGGVPQLAKLDQCGAGSIMGIRYHGRFFVGGSRVTDPTARAREWKDELYQQLNTKTWSPMGRKYARRS